MGADTKKRRNKPASKGPMLRPTPDSAYEGLPTKLPTNKLPLYRDVGLAMEMHKITNTTCNPVKMVTDCIMQVYDKASIPTLAYLTVLNKVSNLETLKKGRLIQLVVDKRTGTTITTGGVDLEETERILEGEEKTENELKEAAEAEARRIERQKLAEYRKLRETERKKRDTAVVFTPEAVFDGEDEPKEKKIRMTKREFKDKLSKLQPIIETAERFGLSDSAVAHMVNATNAKSSTISEDSPSEILYRSKVKRIRKIMRSEKVEESKGKEPIAIGFDERQDKSKVEVGKGIKGCKRFETKKVEHCAVIFWPGEEFVGHVVPRDGTGAGLSQDIIQFFKDRETNLQSLKAVLTDGCNKMTGWKLGACSMIEEELITPLQRIVCFLHHLELPFGKVFEFYDGPTTGPESFSGPVGKTIMTDIWKLPIVTFAAVENPTLLLDIKSLPKEVFSTFNKDHQYIMRMVEAILTGEISEQWAQMKSGNVVQSRWTNTQSRCCRAYLSTVEPTFQLQRIVHFIIHVYAPLFLKAKHFNKAEDGPGLLVKEMQAVKLHCPPAELSVVQTCIQRNGFFGHPENVLLALLSSQDPGDRLFAVQQIQRIRSLKVKKRRTKKKVRAFKVLYYFLLLFVYCFFRYLCLTLTLNPSMI